MGELGVERACLAWDDATGRVRGHARAGEALEMDTSERCVGTLAQPVSLAADMASANRGLPGGRTA